MADGQPPAAADDTAARDHALANRGLEQVDLVLDRQHVGFVLGGRPGRVAASTVEHRRNHARVQEAVLLGEPLVERKLEVNLSAAEITTRLAKVQKPEKPALGYMKRYRKLVSTAARGAVLE